MDPDLRELLEDDEYREALAENAYLRERVEEAARQKEFDIEEGTTYWTVVWQSLSADAKRPYRTAVATALDAVISIKV